VGLAANRRAKLLIYQAMEGSILNAYSATLISAIVVVLWEIKIFYYM
jgi:hypothetical protein